MWTSSVLQSCELWGTPGRSGPEASDSFRQDTHEQVEEKPGGYEDLGALNSSFTLSQGQFLL